jgi:hypothetical protein
VGGLPTMLKPQIAQIHADERHACSWAVKWRVVESHLLRSGKLAISCLRARKADDLRIRRLRRLRRLNADERHAYYSAVHLGVAETNLRKSAKSAVHLVRPRWCFLNRGLRRLTQMNGTPTTRLSIREWLKPICENLRNLRFIQFDLAGASRTADCLEARR